MKKLLIASFALLSLSASAANWKCSIENVCSPLLSPFYVNKDKAFIEFPELTEDESIIKSGQIQDVLFFDFNLGSVEIVVDDGIVNNSPLGGRLDYNGETFDITCVMDL